MHDMLKLAIQSQLPLIHLSTDDVLNLEEVLVHISGQPVQAIALPEQIAKVSDLKLPDGIKVFVTSSNCRSLAKLYRFSVDKEVTFIFVNVDYDVLMFACGTLYPPQKMVLDFLQSTLEDPAAAEELLPAFGGLTLKDVAEIARLTMTRDECLTASGVSITRRGYVNRLRGINQVDTVSAFYAPYKELVDWLHLNKPFFISQVHPALMPRGLLFDGPAGTGKTEGAKYIANEFGVPLYRLDLGAMMGKYVGDSEGNLMAAIAQVDQVAPCVVLFDEVEKIFGTGGGDSGVSSRMLSQLLWWLQEHKTQVFSVMTTNNVGAIPKELYRPGRIDKTMTFKGITTQSEAVAFCKSVWEAFTKDLELPLDTATSAKIAKAMASLFVDGGPVSQSTLTFKIKDMIKQAIAG